MAHEEFRPNDLWGAVSHVVEEMGEVGAALGKSLRFGFDSVNPLIPEEQRETNAEWVWREVEDLRLAIVSLQSKMKSSGVVK